MKILSVKLEQIAMPVALLESPHSALVRANRHPISKKGMKMERSVELLGQCLQRNIDDTVGVAASGQESRAVSSNVNSIQTTFLTILQVELELDESKSI